MKKASGEIKEKLKSSYTYHRKWTLFKEALLASFIGLPVFILVIVFKIGLNPITWLFIIIASLAAVIFLFVTLVPFVKIAVHPEYYRVCRAKARRLKYVEPSVNPGSGLKGSNYIDMTFSITISEGHVITRSESFKAPVMRFNNELYDGFEMEVLYDETLERLVYCAPPVAAMRN